MEKNNFPVVRTINLPACLTLSPAEDDNKDLSVFVASPCVTLFDAEVSRRPGGHAQSREARERVTKCLSRERDKKKKKSRGCKGVREERSLSLAAVFHDGGCNGGGPGLTDLPRNANRYTHALSFSLLSFLDALLGNVHTAATCCVIRTPRTGDEYNVTRV